MNTTSKPDLSKRAAQLQERLRKNEEEAEKIKRQLADEKNKMARAAAHRARILAQQERAKQTRIKILLGIAIQDAIRKGRVSSESVKMWLDEALTRDSERALFGMGPVGQASGLGISGGEDWFGSAGDADKTAVDDDFSATL